jgi:uncharacterized damage-inducible protein DinB
MKELAGNLDRRNFIKTSAVFTTGILGLSGLQALNAYDISSGDDLFLIGPIEGYSPQIGTLVSMLNYNRQTIVNTVKSLTMEQLDYLHDANANTIGALILHLGAVEKFYQIWTFEGRQHFNKTEKKIWGVPTSLGDEGRKQLKGQEVNYYLDMINEVRQKTIEEFKKKDDKWLMAIDPESPKERPVNTYWKWFHVCEHESNHRGQMTWLKSRLPGANPSKD